MRSALPATTRGFVRLLRAGEARERALADLEAVYARVQATRGPAAARRACVREAALIVLWGAADGLRRVGEGGRSTNGPRRRSMLGDVAQDLRHGVRSLLRRPGFAAVVVGVLGLGIGANAAIFTLADRLFLRPAPLVEAPDELVRVFRSWGVRNAGGSLSYPDYLDYREGARTLTGLAAFGSSPLVATARAGDASTTVRVLTITSNYFAVLGVAPAAGRLLRPDENVTAGAHPLAIVSSGFVEGTLGGDAAAVVGRDLHLNGERFTIVGVAARGFRGLGPADAAIDVYIPILMRDALAPSSSTAWRERLPDQRERWISAVGRVRAGATVAAVQADLDPIAERIRALDGGSESEGVLVTGDYRWYPGTAARLGNITRVLLIAVALLLACAMANVTILLLARASARDREMGIRSALGAARGRVVRQLLTESLLLGVAGCIAGVLVAMVAARVAAALLPVSIAVPLWPDARMLGVALAISLLTSLLVGIAPARRSTRADVYGTIQGRNRRAGGTGLRDALVVLQIALSLVLVAGATLFARSLSAARSVNVGFDPEGVLLIGVDLGNHGYDAERGRAFVDAALERLRALPAVTAVAGTRQVPFRGDWSTDLEPWPDARFAGGRTTLTTGLNAISPEYFEVMGVPLERGRAFTSADHAGGVPVVVVNETFARLAFEGEDALGRTVSRGPDQTPWTIVGIARDAVYYDLGEERWPQMYLPLAQQWMADITFAIRTPSDPRALIGPAQAVLRALDADVALASIETLAAVHAEQLARYRATAHVVGLTGLIALLLASAGLYGVMAYRVSERTREIGLRMALGASRRSLARTILLRGLRLSIVGIALGTAAALVLGRLVEASLFGVPARDPMTLAVAPLVLLAVAIAALLVPARRAMDVDPMRAMRTD